MVITLDKHKKPLGFTTEKRARQLMEQKRACIYRTYPMIIIMKDIDVREKVAPPSCRIKIDPGSAYTGIAIIEENTNKVCLYMQIEHRGYDVKGNLDIRRIIRKNRRSRETWYRRPKFGNQTGDGGTYQSSREEGWLPPSIKSIANNIINWVKKLKKWIRIESCSFEAVRFDTQKMDNKDIEGVEYQHGTLFGYEIKEYLLDRYGHTCQYCGGESKDPILEWEHMKPKSRGGSDSVKNATLSCHRCNRDKDNLTPEEWLEELKKVSKPTKLIETRIKNIPDVIKHKVVGVSDRNCAWVNSSRRYIERHLFQIFETVECSSGGRTKYNRETLKLPKDHHYDALCVGTVPEKGYIDRTKGYVLYVKAMGRGTGFRGKINKCGIIIKKLAPRAKRVFGFMNGDIVSVDNPKGKYAGHYVGRVMVRKSGSFDIRTTQGDLITAPHSCCKILQYVDGYQYRMAIPLGH